MRSCYFIRPTVLQKGSLIFSILLTGFWTCDPTSALPINVLPGRPLPYSSHWQCNIKTSLLSTNLKYWWWGGEGLLLEKLPTLLLISLADNLTGRLIAKKRGFVELKGNRLKICGCTYISYYKYGITMMTGRVTCLLVHTVDVILLAASKQLFEYIRLSPTQGRILYDVKRETVHRHRG